MEQKFLPVEWDKFGDLIITKNREELYDLTADSSNCDSEEQKKVEEEYGIITADERINRLETK